MVIAMALVLLGLVTGCGSAKRATSTEGGATKTSEVSPRREALNQVAKEVQTGDRLRKEGAESLRREKENGEAEERRQQEQPHELGSACKGSEAGSAACAQEVEHCEATPSCSRELAKAKKGRDNREAASEADTAKIMSEAEERYNKKQDELMERERSRELAREGR